MTSNLANTDLAAQLATLMARADDLQGQLDALDRGVVDTGVAAAEAIAKASAVEHDLHGTGQVAAEAIAKASTIERDLHVLVDVFSRPSVDYAPHHGDPLVERLQARKRRIEKSGLRLISGGAA
jgi:hypothetical protein